ncbi:MAG TPA: Ldh family oxidoreductase [Candidatus Limnocylindrales bacterium]|nr:Ldh family oxidoreductase [Candidatus Limnocylindrales bacterium]
MKIAIKDLRSKVLTALSQNGLTEEQNLCIAEQVIWADMSGIKPMGVAKLTGTEPLQNMKPTGPITIERETKLSQLIDAGGYPAPLICQQATDVAIRKAEEHGFAMVGVRNTFSSNLAQAFYVEKIASKDLIGIAMARGPASTAPFESIDPLFATNPIGFSFPTNGEPLVFDMTTAAMTWSGLILAKANGETLPPNIAIDPEGSPTTDPKAAMAGATLPFDGSYKGSGLGLIVETFGGPLVGSLYCDPALDHEYGSLIMAIDPNLLVDVADFKSHSSDMIQKIKSSRKRPGVDEIRLPGERARKSRKQAMESGLVEIDDSVAHELGWL